MRIGKASHSYRPEIDGLRALAVLAIVLYHAFPAVLPGGFVGVDIFFVISGYLISSIILSALDEGTFSLAAFYARRIRRIFPALIVVLSVSAVAGWLLLLATEYKQLGKHIWGGAFFFSNFIFWHEAGYFDNAAETKPLLHLWSLAVEEQFYIFFPLVLRLASIRRGCILPAIAIIAAVSFVLNLKGSAADPVGDFFSPLTRFWEIMTGALLAGCERKAGWLPPQLRRLRNILSVAGLLLVAVAVLMFSSQLKFPGCWALLPTLGAALLIASTGEAWLHRRIFSHPALVWIGLVSFSLYLWHWPLLAFARIVKGSPPSALTRAIAMACAMLLAEITRRLVENPCRFGDTKRLKTISIAALLAVVGLCGVAIYRLNGLPERFIYTGGGEIRLANNIDARVSSAAHCPISGGIDPDFRINCWAHENMGKQPLVILWGDSSSMSWRPVVVKFARELGFELYVIGHPGCPPLPGTKRVDGGQNAINCARGDEMSHILAQIVALRPAVVIIAGRWSLYTQGWIRGGKLDKSTHFITDSDSAEATQEGSVRTIGRALRRLLAALEEIGSTVLVVKEVPVLLDTINNTRKTEAEIVPTKEEHLRVSRPFDDLLKSMPQARVLDPADRLCPSSCIARKDGGNLYLDDSHLNQEGSEFFAPEFGAFLKEAIKPH